MTEENEVVNWGYSLVCFNIEKLNFDIFSKELVIKYFEIVEI